LYVSFCLCFCSLDRHPSSSEGRYEMCI